MAPQAIQPNTASGSFFAILFPMIAPSARPITVIRDSAKLPTVAPLAQKAGEPITCGERLAAPSTASILLPMRRLHVQHFLYVK
jgi:hypothetical protein